MWIIKGDEKMSWEKLVEKILGEFTRTKAWWKSKTLWVNIIALAVLLIQSQYGFVVSVEEQAALIVIANLVLRAATGEGLTTE